MAYTTSVKNPRSIMISYDQVERRQKDRIRDIAALRWVLNGKPLQEFADHHGIRASTVREAASRVSVLLYYRAKDRTGITTVPNGLKSFIADAAFWLEKLDDNIERLKELDPENLKP